MTEQKIKTINNYPLAFTVFFVTALLTTVANKLFDSQDKINYDCKDQVLVLRARIDKLESLVDDYTISVLFKNEQIKSRDKIIDSIKNEK